MRRTAGPFVLWLDSMIIPYLFNQASRKIDDSNRGDPHLGQNGTHAYGSKRTCTAPLSLDW